MTITREQAADLRAGDVVEVRHETWGEDNVLRGSLYDHRIGGGRWIGPIAFDEGLLDHGWTITVVSRAPRPLYVNHDRAEPVPGDVVRDADSSNDRHVWVKNVAGFSNEWLAVPGHVYVPRSQLPERLCLLVDGATGQVVP